MVNFYSKEKNAKICRNFKLKRIFKNNMKDTIFRLIAIFCVFTFAITGCAPLKKLVTSRDIDAALKRSEVFGGQFTGFVLYDPATSRYLKDHHGDLHFTPASNTKILTTLACLNALPDSIPSFLTDRSRDTLQLIPFGDPSFLHPDFPHQPIIHQLKNRPVVVKMPGQDLSPFGAGWAWDDYHYSYQSERSWLPIYGNEVRVFNRDTLKVVPGFFSNYVNLYVGQKPGSLVYRERKYNLFNVWMEYDTSSFERKIPFEYSNELMARLLSDTTGAHVGFTTATTYTYDTLYNAPLLPALALMMQRSDNFLAEQLLIVAARASGYTNIDAYREYMVSQWQLPSSIQWVDGSGLSRYNLITPKSLVSVLNRIYQQVDWADIEAIFPTGGVSGTIKTWYHGNPPYVFAKTGTLSNNHCLSGYLRTNSGKVLIFSFMNNHYLRPVSEVKKEMQLVLEAVRDAY